MARLTLKIAPDGLSAEAEVAAGPAMTREQLDQQLAQAGIVHGCDDDALAAVATLLATPEGAGRHVVARGQGASHGKDGHLDPQFTLGQIVGELCKDGHVDFHERRLLQPIASGELIATVHEPTPGSHGTDVRGRQLAAKPGAPAKVRLGTGARREADRIFATRGGVIFADDKGLDVVPLYQHRGDVDLRSGNLHSEGSLEVAGDVCDGFAAAATGDVLVRGAVQSAKVTAGGSVHVDHGILGTQARVEAGVDLTCRHATGADLQAGGTILIGDQLAHCRARGDRIFVAQGRGQVLGGELRAGTSIEVNAAGTKEGAATLLSVADLFDERRELAQLSSEAARASRAAGRGIADGRLSRGKSARTAVRAEDRSEAERLRLIARQRELLTGASVVVHGVVHAGVQVRLGDLLLRIDAPRQGVRFSYDRDQHRIHQEFLP